jgi:hypothetical protein
MRKIEGWEYVAGQPDATCGRPLLLRFPVGLAPRAR